MIFSSQRVAEQRKFTCWKLNQDQRKKRLTRGNELHLEEKLEKKRGYGILEILGKFALK